MPEVGFDGTIKSVPVVPAIAEPLAVAADAFQEETNDDVDAAEIDQPAGVKVTS